MFDLMNRKFGEFLIFHFNVVVFREFPIIVLSFLIQIFHFKIIWNLVRFLPIKVGKNIFGKISLKECAPPTYIGLGIVKIIL